jgi:glucuronate isomerase
VPGLPLFWIISPHGLATTDDPLDSLESHKALASDPSFHGRVLPTFRPDAYLNIAHPAWTNNVDKLITAAADGGTGYGAYLTALQFGMNKRKPQLNTQGRECKNLSTEEPWVPPARPTA